MAMSCVVIERIDGGFVIVVGCRRRGQGQNRQCRSRSRCCLCYRRGTRAAQSVPSYGMSAVEADGSVAARWFVGVGISKTY